MGCLVKRFELRNDGDWYCKVCGAKVRTFCGAPCDCDVCATKRNMISSEEAFWDY